MAIAFGGLLNSATNKTTGTTVTLTTGAAVPVNALVVVIWAADNLTTTTPTLSSVTDSKGNTYSILANVASGTNTANAGQKAAIAVSRITTALTSTDTISAVSSSASTVVKAVDASYFTGATTTVRATATTATGNSTAPSVIYGSGLAGDLVLGFVANQSTSLPTGDSDTTNGTWGGLGGVASSGGGAAANIAVFGQYKILTGSGSQTYNVTITSGQWSIGAVALVPAAVTISRTATGSGIGTGSGDDQLVHVKTATGSGVSSESAVDVITKLTTATGTATSSESATGSRIKSVTATGSGSSTESATGFHIVPRTATGTALGDSSATRLLIALRTATGNGIGTGSGDDQLVHTKTASGSGSATQSADGLIIRSRTASSSGSGSSVADGLTIHLDTATGAGAGAGAAVGVIVGSRVERTATGSGSGSSSASGVVIHAPSPAPFVPGGNSRWARQKKLKHDVQVIPESKKTATIRTSAISKVQGSGSAVGLIKWSILNDEAEVLLLL